MSTDFCDDISIDVNIHSDLKLYTDSLFQYPSNKFAIGTILYGKIYTQTNNGVTIRNTNIKKIFIGKNNIGKFLYFNNNTNYGISSFINVNNDNFNFKIMTFMLQYDTIEIELENFYYDNNKYKSRYTNIHIYKTRTYNNELKLDNIINNNSISIKYIYTFNYIIILYYLFLYQLIYFIY
jgi:hypothetical protein